MSRLVAPPPLRLRQEPGLPPGDFAVSSRPARNHSRLDLLGVDYRLVLPQAVSHRSYRRLPMRGIVRDSILRDTWLKIPQAVVLELTGDLEQAKELKEDNPNLLLIKAILLLPPLISIDVDTDLDDLETLQQKYSAAMDSRAEESVYESGLRRVHAKLVKGVTTKGSRAPNLPVEVIDAAEFSRLELCGVDAVDARTEETVWRSLLISARELLEGNSEDPSYGELYTLSSTWNRLRGERSGGPEGVAGADTLLELAVRGATPLSDRDLRSWYEQRVQELTRWGKTASGEADWAAVRRQYPGRVTRARVRALRKIYAPADWKKLGRRSPPETE